MTQFSPKVPAARERPFCRGVREAKTSQDPALYISSCFQCLQGQETASSIDRTAPILARVFLGAFLNRTGSSAPQLGSGSQPIMPLQPQGRGVRAPRAIAVRTASRPSPAFSPISLRQRPCKAALEGFRGQLFRKLSPKWRKMSKGLCSREMQATPAVANVRIPVIPKEHWGELRLLSRCPQTYTHRHM